MLKVISSSPGELEPVFQAMLENATRICEAKFGGLVLFEGDAYPTVALKMPRQHMSKRKRETRFVRLRHPATPQPPRQDQASQFTSLTMPAWISRKKR